MSLLILFLFLYESFEYNPSLYAPKTDDYIVALEADTYYLLENISTPAKAKHIKEAQFTSEVIPDEKYAWPGHVREIDEAIEIEEGEKMYNFYKNRVNLTQDDIYYHPKAPEQTWSTWEDVDSLQRAKVKVTLDPYHHSWRISGLYMPPGELITFEILPEAVNLVRVILEPHRQIVSIQDRLRYLQCETLLSQPKTTWGYPTGGAISFELADRSKNVPIEINVTGCVITPHFIYGVTDEKEWEESLRYIKSPSAMFTNGAINEFVPAKEIRELDRMDDAMAWLRSAALRSQEIAPDPIASNDKYRIRHPLNWRYDNYVGCGIACAYAGGNLIDFTPDWAAPANDIINLKNKNPWGTIHEMNHHHQDGWGFSDLDPALTEGTNNVLNTFIYTYQNSASAQRTVNDNLEPVCIVDHLETIHPYCLVDWQQIEAEWDIIFHCLGHEVFKKYMDLNIKNEPFSWQLYNGYGKHILTLMDATGYDVYEYCKWYCDVTSRKQPKELIGDKFDAFWNCYTNHPAYGKYFHFMGCYYACGFIRNGQRFETARPFKINPVLNTTFDFNKSLKQRSGNKTLWGDFVFDHIESKTRPEAWTETSKGIFQYKPVDDLSFIDEALAYYLDRTTGEEFINIVRLELRPIDRVHTVYYYNYTDDVCNRDKSVEDCYKNLNKHTLYKQVDSDYKGIPWINERNLTAVTDFHFTPTETGDFNFRALISERGFVYLSEKPLTGDFDTDEPYRILTKHWYHGLGSGDVNGGLYRAHFEKGKKYYVRLVVNNADKPSVCTPDQDLCRPQTGLTIYAKNIIYNEWVDESNVIPDSWFVFQESMDFIPSLIDFKYNDAFDGERLLRNSPTKWQANVSMNIKYVYTLTNTDYDWSQGKQCPTDECDDTDVSKTLIDGDPTTEVRSGWWPPNEQGQPFPHIWDVNFNGEETFDTIYLKGAYNQNHFPMDSDISIYLNKDESSSVGIETDENLIYDGVYKSKDDLPIKLSEQQKGKYLRIVIKNNRVNWKDGHPGRSSFSYISVGKYHCLSKYKAPRGCKWEVRKDGYYLNGRSFVGKAGDSYSYFPDEGINQVGIVGDKFPGMGTAKVYLDGKLDKVIDDSLLDFDDLKAMKYASRSYRKLLYTTPLFYNRPEIKIVVESGEFRITGFAVGTTNESVIINNGPMPTNTPTLYPDPTLIPDPTPQPPVIPDQTQPPPVIPDQTPQPVIPDQTPQPVIPDQTQQPVIPDQTPQPVIPDQTQQPVIPDQTPQPPVIPDQTPKPSSTNEIVVNDPTSTVVIPDQTQAPPVVTGPTIDDSSKVSGDEIHFTHEGFIDDGGSKHDTTSIDSDVILIKGDSTSVTLTTDTEKEPLQDKYFSVQKPNTEITISLPPSGDYGKGEIGIHPNSQDPKVNIQTSSVPLNIFNDNDNTISLQTVGDASTKESITISKITSTNGKLDIKLPNNVKYIEAKEINIFNEGKISSFAGSNPVETVVGQLNLNDGSNSVISNINIKNGLNANANTKLNIEGKAVFDSKSSISLTDSSFIEFGKSVISGVCNKITLLSSKRNANLLDNEKNLICGQSFDCNQWLKNFEGNSDYPDSKCALVNDEKCLVVFKKQEDQGGNNGGGDGKKKSSTGIIIAVVVVVVVVAVAAVVGFIVYRKMKNKNSSSFDILEGRMNETMNTEDNDDPVYDI